MSLNTGGPRPASPSGWLGVCALGTETCLLPRGPRPSILQGQPNRFVYPVNNSRAGEPSAQVPRPSASVGWQLRVPLSLWIKCVRVPGRAPGRGCEHAAPNPSPPRKGRTAGHTSHSARGASRRQLPRRLLLRCWGGGNKAPLPAIIQAPAKLDLRPSPGLRQPPGACFPGGRRASGERIHRYLNPSPRP